MKPINNTDLIEKEFEKYSEEEFYSIINLIDNKELIQFIKKNSKQFSKDTKGWRIDKLDKNKLKEIYYKGIYKRKDFLLGKYLIKLIQFNLAETNNIIRSEFDIEDLKVNLTNYNHEKLDKLLALLLNTPFEENIIIYFKAIDIELSEEIKLYIEEKIKIKKAIKEELLKLEEEIITKYNEKIKLIQKQHAEEIKSKDKAIKELNTKIEDLSSELNDIVIKKDQKIANLNEDKICIEMKFTREVEKSNSKISELNQKIESYITDKNRILDLYDKREQENKRLLNLLENKCSSFDKFAKEKWDEENQNLHTQIKELENNINELKINKIELEEEINSITEEKEKIETSITTLEDKSEAFINHITYVMNRIGKSEATQSMINVEVPKESNSSIYHTPSKQTEGKIDEIYDVSEFINELADNFECAGVGKDYAYDFAKYTYATIKNNMGLLAVGYNARIIADAISYTVNNSTADKIVIPPGHSNVVELIDKISSLESKVVLIENAIDNIADSVYMPLIKENKDKILIFSMESSENINILPKAIFNYVMAVDLDSILESEPIDELYPCRVSDDLLENTETREVRKSKLSNSLNKLVDLGNISKLKMLEVINIINNIDNDSNRDIGIYYMILFSLGMICKGQEKLDKLEEFINKQNFDNDKLKNLEIFIEMEEEYAY
ncbi:hypothetical protein PN290_01480 [Romboutsia sp. 1001216sp1]|uniref:hypothetical protein n=1 Tax=unclassified Romboutsia TaxID=2626894 RepID=UPI0018A9275C|nr:MULTISPECIES: hypothetical protein [unclassified Romboutsia]MDB8794606.1 hypothetical protein [Romboutsia sp. 1001216sp1]MDB8796560.1 hypothetical protein [Romboutsia sp. 1001216sp1]MDB8798038.1 hypothetical protein [Romboutsia sp. 1001216sp1]